MQPNLAFNRTRWQGFLRRTRVMAELAGKDPVIKVLTEAKGAMHYTDIVQAIAAKDFKTKVGGTLAASIAATISLSF